MKRMTLTGLTNCFELAKEINANYVGVKIEMQGFDKPEIIINPTTNFDAKLEYYKKAYNEDLTLKTFNGIRIVGFTYGETYSDIEYELLYRKTTNK
jgi:hypothetical protein